MIALSNITLQFGERYLYRNATATISSRDCIGLVGSNGSGKSTLLKVLNGNDNIDSGTIEKAKYVTIGYLPQDGIEMHGLTLFKEVESAFPNVIELKTKIDAASNRLQSIDTQSDEYSETLELIGTWEHELQDLDADKLPSMIESILLGLGFESTDMSRLTNEFSGGWQMRIALAKLLLANPSLLLLDEPTNHLDIDSQRWLENYLKQYQGALLIVSHDRAFLDELCHRIFELTLGQLNSYTGGYSAYETQSKLRKEQLIKAQKNQQRELEKTERFVERFRSKASKAKQVQSRIKALDKVERIELDEEEDEIGFNFASTKRSGQTVIQTENLCKAYGELKVIENATIRIERGDRIAVVGVNGAGKSTLARTLAGIEPYQFGERTLGHNVDLSYFAQHQADELDPSLDILTTLEKASTQDNVVNLRTTLGAFLFKGDDVFKKIKVLSGGEKNRVALAKMLVQPANFLILDEPTNHLDMRSQRALQRALLNFDGTYIIVSHNRAFVDDIVNKVLEVRKDGLSLFPGNVSDYIRHKELTENPTPKAGPRSEAQDSEDRQESPKERRQRRAQLQKEISPLKSQSKKLEEQIAILESDAEELESKMADPEFYKSPEAKESMIEYDKMKATLDSVYEAWSALSDQIAEKEAALDL